MPRIQTLVTVSILAGVALGLCAPEARAQLPPGADSMQRPALPDSVQRLLAEFQQVQQRLGAIQEKALEANPVLAERQDSVRDVVESVMVEMNPALEARIDRLDEIEDSATVAREASDTARVMELLGEARQIQSNLQQSQTRAMQRDSVAREVQGFRERLLTAMREVDPETDRLLKRLREVTLRIQTIRQGGTPPGGPPGGPPGAG